MQSIVDSVYKCEICGQETHRQIYHINEHLWLCPNCSSQLHTCAGCASRAECDLERNPQQIPPYIIQKATQGGITIQQQVINPKLIEAYCIKCKCFKNEYCLRCHCGGCELWELHPEYKKEE